MTNSTAGPSASAATDWVRILVWPFLILIVLLIFKPEIASILDFRDKQALEVTRDKAGSYTLKVVKSALAAQAATNQATATPGAVIAPGSSARVSDAAVVAAGDIKRLQGKTILWIDDNPSNNTLLSNAFTELGIKVILALSTEEALQKVEENKGNPYSLIITDMGRPDSKTAGLDFISRNSLKQVPTLIYSASWSVEHRGQEEQFGAKLISNDPSRIYNTVINLLQN